MARHLFRVDLSGQKFGLLTVVAFSHVDELRRAIWVCACECGGQTKLAASILRSGHTRSCGCMLAKRLALGTLRHGKSKSPIWATWIRMHQRCYAPSTQRFKNYGGRGITVCEPWHTFENFYADMGDVPAGMTLERMDVDGHYEPGNCEWVSADAQYSNTTRTVRVVFHGVEIPFRVLVAASGIKYETAYARLRTLQWSPERIFPDIKPESLHEHVPRQGTLPSPDSQRSASPRPRKS